MTFKNYVGLAGTALVICSALSPMIHLPVIGNWNYWDLEPVIASLVFICAFLGLLASVLMKPGLLRISGWAVLILTLFTLAAVYFKVNDYFSFIPFKKLASVAARIVHYKWMGWSGLIAGSVIMVLAGRSARIK